MSENKKSFFSSIPGLITGLAGLLTGIVGLVTVLIQLDVIGGSDDDAGPVAAGGTTTVAPAAGGSAPAGGATTSTTIAGRLVVEPVPIKLQATERAKTVTVRNATTATVTVQKPEYTGPDRTAFSTDTGCTNVALTPGRSCTMQVTLTPTGPLRSYKANLVLEARELGQATEVPVEAVTIL